MVDVHYWTGEKLQKLHIVMNCSYYFTSLLNGLRIYFPYTRCVFVERHSKTVIVSYIFHFFAGKTKLVKVPVNCVFGAWTCCRTHLMCDPLCTFETLIPPLKLLVSEFDAVVVQYAAELWLTDVSFSAAVEWVEHPQQSPQVASNLPGVFTHSDWQQEQHHTFVAPVNYSTRLTLESFLLCELLTWAPWTVWCTR